jgi:hypothetical protein
VLHPLRLSRGVLRTGGLLPTVASIDTVLLFPKVCCELRDPDIEDRDLDAVVTGIFTISGVVVTATGTRRRAAGADAARARTLTVHSSPAQAHRAASADSSTSQPAAAERDNKTGDMR